MKRILTITAICICAFSCSQSPEKTASRSLDQLTQEFMDVILDSTVSWKQVTDVVYPFVDSLCIAAADENNLKNRMFGQQWGCMTIELMSDKYAELNDAGKDVDYDDLTKILGQIVDGLNLWFSSDDERLPHLWRDQYYVCHQHSEEPTYGFFHLMVAIPTEDKPEPTLHIFYPDAAEGSPVIIFAKHIDGENIEEDENSRDLVYLEDWSPKDSAEEGYPMCAIGDASVVEKMLNYDEAYLMFESGESANGDPGETEIALIYLDSFQKQWKKIVH